MCFIESWEICPLEILQSEIMTFENVIIGKSRSAVNSALTLKVLKGK
jgi:hypothetical protein